MTSTAGDPFESGTTYHSGVHEFNPDFVYGGHVAHLYFSVFVHVERSFFSLYLYHWSGVCHSVLIFDYLFIMF